MQKLSLKDRKNYLKSGFLTNPFLDGECLKEKVAQIYSRKVEKGKQANEVKCLCSMIASAIKMGDANFRQQYKFKRTAQQIWESGLATGCTDYAILFATFARQLGWPTTILHTAELGWLQRFLDGQDSRVHYGHSFCECFYGDKWVLVDATSRKIVFDYNSDKIELPYNVGPGNVYIPYLRELDPGKTSMQEHNLEMEELCKALK